MGPAAAAAAAAAGAAAAGACGLLPLVLLLLLLLLVSDGSEALRPVLPLFHLRLKSKQQYDWEHSVSLWNCNVVSGDQELLGVWYFLIFNGSRQT